MRQLQQSTCYGFLSVLHSTRGQHVRNSRRSIPVRQNSTTLLLQQVHSEYEIIAVRRVFDGQRTVDRNRTATHRSTDGITSHKPQVTSHESRVTSHESWVLKYKSHESQFRAQSSALELTTHDSRLTTHDEQRATSNEQRATSNEQRTTNNGQRTTNNEQRTTSNEQRATSNEQRTTNNEQRTTNNEQRATKQRTPNNVVESIQTKHKHAPTTSSPTPISAFLPFTSPRTVCTVHYSSY